jgi:hypothetical protein
MSRGGASSVSSTIAGFGSSTDAVAWSRYAPEDIRWSIRWLPIGVEVPIAMSDAGEPRVSTPS